MNQAKNIFSTTSQNIFLIKSWEMLFALSAIFFAPFIFYFLWGNHDWQWIKEYTPLWSGVFEGRFTQFFLQTFLYNGNILPILTLLTSLAFYTAGTILLLRLWHAPSKRWIYLLLGLNLVTAPYTISWLYFAFITLSCLSWPFFIIVGFYLLQKHKSTQHPHLFWAAAALCFFLALGGYPPVINLIGTIFFSLILLSLCTKKETFKTIINKSIPYITAILFAIILLLATQHLLKKYGWQLNTYNTSGINLSQINEKLNIIFLAAIEQFFISTSFISFTYKYIFFFLFLLAVIQLYLQVPNQISAKLLFTIALAGLILSPQITLLAAQNIQFVIHEPRISFFSLTYIYIFAAMVLLQSPSRFIKNITTLALALMVLYNLNTTAYAAKIWNLGFKAEANFSERFLSRIENIPTFSAQQKYTFVQGGNLNFRQRYYLPDTAYIDGYTLSAPYIPWHLPAKAYHFYSPYLFVADDYDTYWRYIPISKINLTPELNNYLLNSATPWPDANAVYLDNSTIILTLTPQGKFLAQQWLMENI